MASKLILFSGFDRFNAKQTMENLTQSQRHHIMQSIRSKNTEIEKELGKAMWALGIRYRKNDKRIFGCPDFTIKKYKIAIFCDGEFFHGKDWDSKKTKISTNKEYWTTKIEKNIRRDQLVNETLAKDNWIVLRFWGEDIMRNMNVCLDRISSAIKERNSSARM